MMRTRRLLALLTLLSAPAAAFGQATTKETKSAARPSIYDAKADARAQVAKATTLARRDSQRVLVMFGGDWCGWCHKLHDLFKSDKAILKLLAEDYRLVMVDTKVPNAEAFLKECSGDLTGVGFPFLAVLDADGKILTRQKTDPLEEGDHHDPKKVLAFLKEWAPPKVEAARVVEAALARASSEDKRVFLHFGAPWCGWCHKLDDFLARDEIAKIMSKDFIDVKVDEDRMIGGKDVEAKFRKNAQGGIPWFAMLDSKGQEIANADGPKGNIGYPAAPEEIDHFIAMLKKSARKMTPEDIETIRQRLTTAAETLKLQQASAARQRVLEAAETKEK